MVESVVTEVPSWLRFQDQVMVLPSAEMFRRPCPNEPSLHKNVCCVKYYYALSQTLRRHYKCR